MKLSEKITDKAIETVTFFRADNYYNNSGNVAGFFTNKEDAEASLEFSNPVKIADGTFGQITEFVVPVQYGEFDVNNTDVMLDVWGEGQIVADYYYN